MVIFSNRIGRDLGRMVEDEVRARFYLRGIVKFFN